MSGETGHPEHLSLSVPTGTQHVGTVRAFVGSVGIHFGLGPEQIDDLKLAVSEICGDPNEPPASGRIRVHVVKTDDALDIEVTGLNEAARPSDEGAEADPALAFRRRLIDALIPDATFTRTDEGMAVRFAVGASG